MTPADELRDIRETLEVGVTSCQRAEARLRECRTEEERAEAERGLHEARIWLAGIACGVWSRLAAREL